METLEVYGDDLDIITLTTHLESLKLKFSSDENSIKDITETLKTISVNSWEYFSQVIVLLKILLVMPASKAVSERLVSNLRRIKDWLRTWMTQNDFCCGKEERWNTFGNFQQ